MEITIKLDRQSKTPLYLQISGQIVSGIKSGELKAGYRLPAERKLARMLGVNRSTVVNAYSELEAAGYVTSHVGRGTEVAAQSGESKEETFRWHDLISGQGESLINPYNSAISEMLIQRNLIAMDSGVAAPELYPKEDLASICSEVLLSEGDSILQHNCPQGLKTLRESLATLMQTRSISVSPENIVVLNGSQQGLDLMARLLIEPGDSVVVEQPTFMGAIDIFRAYGARLIGVPVDAEGMVTEGLEGVLNRARPKLIYTISTYQNPTGISMSTGRRRRLLELAARYQVPILEDDAYGYLHYGSPPPPPLKSMDGSGLVVYLGSMSKILSCGIRLGWMAVPPDLARLVTAAKQLTDLHTNNLSQRVADIYIRRGLLEKHIFRVREQNRIKRDTMLHALEEFAPGGLSWHRPDGGLYVWASLPGSLSAVRLLQEAVERKVSFVAGPVFYSNGEGQNKIRLNFTYAAPEMIRKGIKILCGTIKDLARERETIKPPGREMVLIV
ncbi:MAG: PLP-dependent aminotransferase family protein [Bacillota bacterium]